MKKKVKETTKKESEDRQSSSHYAARVAIALLILAAMLGYSLVSLGAAPTVLETASNGAMKQYYKSDADRTAVISWIKSGAGKAGYDAVVAPILAGSCIACHSPKGTVPTINLTTYNDVLKYAK